MEALAEARRQHSFWGARKLILWLAKRQPDLRLPAASTAGDILKRLGLVKDRRRRRHLPHPGRPTTEPLHPNQLWSADFKGQFKTRDSLYCYPLTVADTVSRYLLGCRSQLSTATIPTKKNFQRIFRTYGLPEAIRTDNGTPFSAATAICRLSRLSVWWIRLGIRPELIQPSHPEQNGRHERMHKTLKAETTRPPAANARAQQRRFDSFRDDYNQLRPHEALHQETPASTYQPSSRQMPRKLPPIPYPAHYEIRLVSRNGGIRWNRQWVNVTHTLGGQYVGLEEVDNDLWDVFFGPLKLGRFDERTLKIEDHQGRTQRRRKLLPLSLD